ncbi:Retrovirus-related Pol polyprotein from transposon 17.6 [Vitis vinifera]|uniref:Retrovirus-related Pol polyprotein from transposon 17.6 n=1 Tax=Vitis vinifera TaxID=29760 RepID=A0A438ISX3_VITVI|nr:Retrovirus-related Pol polyprotein from transposon 17.6 [Vitis vinifera]
MLDIDDEILQPNSDRDSSDNDSNPIDERVSPATGDVKTIDFGIEDQPRELKIGLPLSTDETDRLIHLLRSYLDVFAWSYEDMSDLDPSIVQHHLPILPHVRPVKMAKLEFVLISETLIKLVMLSFMDGFSGYNKILMALEDMEKTTFITEWGHMISEQGIEVNLDKIKVILNMLVLRTEKEIRGFLGRKNQPTIWNDDFQIAFEKIKEHLLSPTVLVPPMSRHLFLLYLLVSDMALGCMLAQHDDSGKERAIYYLSKRILEYEMRYVMIECLYLALVWTTKRLRHYMTEYSVCLISRLDQLRYLFDKPALNGRLMRWLVLLTEFDIQPVDNDFLDEEFIAMTSLSCWRMYFDGATNQSGFGIGVFLISPQETALELGIRQMKVFGDSNLVLRQIQGDWRTRDIKLRSYCAYLELLVGIFDDLRYTRLPRAQNQFADALATLASSMDIPTDVVIRPLLIESRFVPAYCCLIRETKVQDDLPWYHDIYRFLRSGTYLEAATTKDQRALRKISPKSSSGHEFILVAIDYFTKWVEAASTRGATHYSLVYGMKTVLLVETEMGSLRVTLEQQILETEWA